MKVKRQLAGLAAAAAAATVAASAVPANAEADGCWRNADAVGCGVVYEHAPGDFREASFTIDYVRNEVTSRNGWLDATRDYSLRTWSGPHEGPLSTASGTYFRACAQDWRGDYHCTQWMS